MKDIYTNLPCRPAMRIKEMKYLFSPDMKFRTWRKLWIALAEAEKELGLPVTQEQIDEMKAHQDDINYDVAESTGKGGPSRCDVPCIRFRRPVPEGEADYSSWGLPPAM